MAAKGRVPSGSYPTRNRLVGNEAIRGADQGRDRHWLVAKRQAAIGEMSQMSGLAMPPRTVSI